VLIALQTEKTNVFDI